MANCLWGSTANPELCNITTTGVSWETSLVTIRILLCVTLAVAPALAQRHKFDLNTSTPEGKLLQEAGQAADDAGKIKLYNEFLEKNPKHAAAAWVYDQVVPLYLKAGDFDKTIAGAESSLAIDPANPVIAYQALQASEQKKDFEGVKKWSAATEAAARKVLALPKPADEEEVEAWKREVDYSQQVIKRTEYSLYATMLQAADPKAQVGLYEELERRNPASEYLGQGAGRYFIALRQTGQEEKAFRVAEKALAVDQNNEDMLAVVASRYLDPGTKDPAKSLAYAAKLVEVMNAKPAPEGVPAADWEKKKTSLVGLGYWIQGMNHGSQSNWAQTDKAFRAALPMIQGQNELLAPAYFYLGLANYRMGAGPKGNKALLADARKFNQACAALKSPYQAQAQKNLTAMGAGK